MWRKGKGKCLYNFCIKRGNDSGEILTGFPKCCPLKKKKIQYFKKQKVKVKVCSYVKELKLLMKDYLLIRMHLFETG